MPVNAYPEQWDVAGLKEEMNRVLGLDLPVDQWAKEEGIADEELISRITRRADEHMAAKVAQWGPDVLRYVEKSILLQTLDHLWREHLVMLEHLRQVVGSFGLRLAASVVSLPANIGASEAEAKDISSSPVNGSTLCASM